uniref:Uncharacterized protein n=1 Tax=Leersia perrieri TaxID=77586 RepID=A0A0D9W209_9ORYZ
MCACCQMPVVEEAREEVGGGGGTLLPSTHHTPIAAPIESLRSLHLDMASCCISSTPHLASLGWFDKIKSTFNSKKLDEANPVVGCNITLILSRTEWTKFKRWIMLDEWTNREYSIEKGYYYTYDCLINRDWWKILKWVLDACKPLYCVLRYADRQKNATLSRFLPRILKARQELKIHLNSSQEEKRVMEKINLRITRLFDTGFMRAIAIYAAGALDPNTHYRYKGHKFLDEPVIAKRKRANDGEGAKMDKKKKGAKVRSTRCTKGRLKDINALIDKDKSVPKICLVVLPLSLSFAGHVTMPNYEPLF